MSTKHPVFQSRWGFHPCDYAMFRKLKFLHLVYLRAVRLAHAWDRWKRKDPHNRVIRRRLRNEQGQTIGYEEPVPLAEPPLCPIFSRKEPQKVFVDKKGVYFKEGFWDEAEVTDDFQITADYATARRPMPRPEEVQPLGCPVARIEELYEQARAWVGHQDMQ